MVYRKKLTKMYMYLHSFVIYKCCWQVVLFITFQHRICIFCVSIYMWKLPIWVSQWQQAQQMRGLLPNPTICKCCGLEICVCIAAIGHPKQLIYLKLSNSPIFHGVWTVRDYFKWNYQLIVNPTKTSGTEIFITIF